MATPEIEIETRRADRRMLAYLTLIFALAHLIFHALGVRFDRTTLFEFMHYMDPELLKHRLLETCFYMHIQPPLLNFGVGLALKLPEPFDTYALHAAFLAFGLTLYLGLYLLERRLGVSRPLAAVVSTVFMLSPSFILFEHWLFYTLPCAVLLIVAALFLFDLLETRRSRSILGFFTTLLLLCSLRSMFHLCYFLLVLAVGVYACKGYRRRVLLLALIPLLLLFSLYFKNYVLFGKFSVCTFSGKNLWITTVGNMGWKDREALIKAGKISELSRVNRWSALCDYPPEYQNVKEFEGIPVLRQTNKSTGAVNYNHLGFIPICDQYGKDAVYVLTHYPRNFVIATALSWYRYFRPATDLAVSPDNRATLGILVPLYDSVLYGKLPIDLAPYSRFFELANMPTYLFLLLGLPLVLAYGLWLALLGKRRLSEPFPDRLKPEPQTQTGEEGLTRAQRLVVLFLCFNILFVAVMGCTFDVLETCRYRFTTDAFSAALLGMLLERVRRWRAARRAPKPGHDS